MIGAASFGADVAVHGVLLGLVYGVLAAGLVLVYRASGVVNFAHGETGALGAAVLAKLVLDEHWPFVVALPTVLALGGAIGAATEVVVARRLARRPRLALLVATIGLSQLLLVGELVLPKIKEVAPFPSPLHRQLVLGSVTLNGPDFLAIAAVPAIVAGLAIWVTRTPSGRALRAAADNPDAARLAGVRPERVSLLAWTLAGVVSTAAAVIADPIQGVVVGQQTETIGAGLLVRALVAALAGRLQSLPLALAGGIGVGLVQALADSGHISQSAVDAVLLGAVLVLVLVRPSSGVESGGPAEGELVTVPPTGRPRPGLAAGALVGVAVLLPVVAGRSSELFSLSRVALYALVGLSVVVLTGWTGQLSLGQFAIVGVGTFGAAALESHGVPFWVTVPVAGALAAAVSLLVGLPALRARGLDLAITTLALAVAASSWLFTQSWLLGPGGVALVNRGRLAGIDLRGPLAYYEVCVGALAAGLVAVGAVRRADLGRRLLAVRAN
ncbi:MAG TPA: ABC transporter permease, partial [Acidimicrobiales bacterium]